MSAQTTGSEKGPVRPEDLEVTLAVRRDLGAGNDQAVIGEFLDRLGSAIDDQVDARVGWKGGNIDEAQAYARNNGGKTVEMTQAGKWLDSTWPYNKLQKAVGPASAKDIWDGVSTRFAWGAAGEVNAFIRGMRG